MQLAQSRCLTEGPSLGPYRRTRHVQVFPEDSRGQYVNKVDFGLVKADLLANYEKPQRDRINVAFEWIKFMLGPLSFKKVRSWDAWVAMADP